MGSTAATLTAVLIRPPRRRAGAGQGGPFSDAEAAGTGAPARTRNSLELELHDRRARAARNGLVAVVAAVRYSGRNGADSVRVQPRLQPLGAPFDGVSVGRASRGRDASARGTTRNRSSGGRGSGVELSGEATPSSRRWRRFDPRKFRAGIRGVEPFGKRRLSARCEAFFYVHMRGNPPSNATCTAPRNALDSAASATWNTAACPACPRSARRCPTAGRDGTGGDAAPELPQVGEQEPAALPSGSTLLCTGVQRRARQSCPACGVQLQSRFGSGSNRIGSRSNGIYSSFQPKLTRLTVSRTL